MREVGVLFEEIVSRMNTSLEFSSYLDKTFYTCDTKWLRVGKMITGKNAIGGDETATITAITKDESFTIDNENLIDLPNCPAPFSIVGTRLATNMEWTKATNNMFDKTPLIWLVESHNEKVYGEDSSIERDMTMKVVFVDETDIVNYSTTAHRINVVEPMLELQAEFVKVINKMPTYKKITDFSRDTFSRFGVETEQGMMKNILDANLSGIVVSFSVSKYKDPCKC